MTTTTETLTSEQIEALRIDAGTHGDTQLVETCRRAEAGDTKARATVARVLAAAESERRAGLPYYAAIEADGTPTGTVYGIGRTPEQALKDARRGIRDGEFAIVPCTERAYSYIESRGGAPSRHITVSRRDGVERREEE
jgi:hypothetical protein